MKLDSGINPYRGEKLQLKNWLENIPLTMHTHRIHSFEEDWKPLGFCPKMKFFHPKLSGWKGMFKLSETSVEDIKECKYFP